MKQRTPKKNRNSSFSEPNSPGTPSSSNEGRNDRSLGHSIFLPSPKHVRHSSVDASLELSTHNFDQGKTNILNSPEKKQNRIPKLLPPETPKSKNNEIFLSPAPELQSPTPVVNLNQKPIREISNNLKTRLTYAYAKMQQNIHSTKRTLDISGNAFPQGTYSNMFAYDSDTENEEVSKTVEEAKKLDRLNEDSHENSAQAAFLKALQSPKKKQRSLSTGHHKYNKSISSKPSEVEAIETLMSLSSPQKRRASGSHDLTISPPPPPPPPSSSSSCTTTTAPNSSISTSTVKEGTLKNEVSKEIFPDRADAVSSTTQSLVFHSEVQTDVETDVESQSD